MMVMIIDNNLPCNWRASRVNAMHAVNNCKQASTLECRVGVDDRGEGE